jgi:hypothetical protein
MNIYSYFENLNWDYSDQPCCIAEAQKRLGFLTATFYHETHPFDPNHVNEITINDGCAIFYWNLNYLTKDARFRKMKRSVIFGDANKLIGLLSLKEFVELNLRFLEECTNDYTKHCSKNEILKVNEIINRQYKLPYNEHLGSLSGQSIPWVSEVLIHFTPYLNSLEALNERYPSYVWD